MKTFRVPTSNRFAAIIFSAAIVTALAIASVHAQDSSSLSSLLGQLTSESKSSTDSTLKSLGGELAAKTESFGSSIAGSPETEKVLTGALQSVLGNKGPEALAEFQKLSAAKLTPDQMKLAKDVGHVGSAYLVQKNLGGLEGSESDVAHIVSSLRSGQLTAALPAIEKVSKNANLTPAQKDLLTSMADKFVPGASKTGEAISGGLKSIPGFGH